MEVTLYDLCTAQKCAQQHYTVANFVQFLVPKFVLVCHPFLCFHFRREIKLFAEDNLGAAKLTQRRWKFWPMAVNSLMKIPPKDEIQDIKIFWTTTLDWRERFVCCFMHPVLTSCHACVPGPGLCKCSTPSNQPVALLPILIPTNYPSTHILTRHLDQG